MSDHYDRYNGMENLHSTNLASLGTDCISRQTAIEALKNRQDDGKGDISRFYNTIIQYDIEAIEQLPPAQPTFNARDTQYNLPIGMDCISRQAVLSLPIYNEKNLYGNIIREYVDIEDVKQLPSIQPDNGLQKLADEIASFKRCVKSENSDYLTGYLCALSVVEGMIADMREVTT